MFANPPEPFAIHPEAPPADAALDLRALTRNLHLLGADYRVLAPQAAGTEAPVLRGSLDTQELRPGLVLYRTLVQDLCSMRTSNLLHPGLKLCMLLSGRSDLAYGSRRFELGPGAAQGQAVLVNLAEPDRFAREWRQGRSERKVTLTLRPEWLAAAGIEDAAVQRFCSQHLAVAPWRPSARALALADQLTSPPLLAPSLQRLWLESRCLDIVAEALGSVLQPPAPPQRPAQGLDARNHRRLLALRDFLDSGAADGLALTAIARRAGMSATHLQRHFPQVAGTSVIGYLRQRRLLRARDALERGEADVAGAAAIAGYTSAANFATAFRRHFGITPRQARQRV